MRLCIPEVAAVNSSLKLTVGSSSKEKPTIAEGGPRLLVAGFSWDRASSCYTKNVVLKRKEEHQGLGRAKFVHKGSPDGYVVRLASWEEKHFPTATKVSENPGQSIEIWFDPCLSGWLPKRWSDVKFPAWTPVVFRRRSPNFSEYSPMMRPAQDTLSTCGGRTGLRA